MYNKIVDILEDVRQEVIREYYSKGLKASGNFERETYITRQARKVILSFPSYTQFIAKFKSNKGGRRPGKQPPPNIIRKWITDKGLKIRDLVSGQFATRTQTRINQLAYLIGRKIAQKGTDIYIGKRQAIDLDRIVDNKFDYRMEEIADRIFERFKI